MAVLLSLELCFVLEVLLVCSLVIVGFLVCYWCGCSVYWLILRGDFVMCYLWLLCLLWSCGFLRFCCALYCGSCVRFVYLAGVNGG